MRKNLKFAILVLAAVVAAEASASTQPLAEWDFQYRENLIWIEVKVENSRPLRFILDSASTHHVISSDAARRLGLKADGEPLLVRRTDCVQEQPTTRPVTLKVGGFAAQKTSLLVLPLDGIDGILGLPLFEKHIVEIDYHASKIRLFDEAPARTAPIELQANEGILGVRLTDSDGKSGLFVLDTGCSRGLLLSRTASSRFDFCRASPPEAHVLYAGGEIRTHRYARTRWQVGAQTISNIEALVCPEMSDGLLADCRWSGLAGNGFLSNFKVTFNLPGNRIFLEPAN